MGDSTEKWVSLEEVAEHLGVSQDAIREWIKKGKLPFYKAGRLYRFRLSEVDEWLIDGKIAD
ncbi:MAG: helix-turn-helix domain-containing protein [Synergistaceae bacterium]|nr:helix-turn-helix domain-containing protein [Synergistaceae bacterium]